MRHVRFRPIADVGDSDNPCVVGAQLRNHSTVIDALVLIAAGELPE
jgi:hypothetical protein